MKEHEQKVSPLIPLNLDGHLFTDDWNRGKKQQIQSRLAADFTGWETADSKFEEQFEKVMKALLTGRKEAPEGSCSTCFDALYDCSDSAALKRGHKLRRHRAGENPFQVLPFVRNNVSFNRLVESR